MSLHADHGVNPPAVQYVRKSGTANNRWSGALLVTLVLKWVSDQAVISLGPPIIDGRVGEIQNTVDRIVNDA